MNRLFIIVPLILASALATPAHAHKGKPDIMGTVTAIDEHRIEVKTLEGKTVSVQLTKDTKYSKGDTPLERSDVKIGMRVVLHLEGEGEQLTVHEVKLAAVK